MPQRLELRCPAFAAMVLLAMSGLVCATELQTSRYEFTEPQMGVPFTIVVYAADEATANRAAGAAYERVKELNSVLSDYEDESELNRLSHGSPHAEPVKVSNDLFRVLWRANELSKRTDGAFDVSVGPLVQLWRRARRHRELPTEQHLNRSKLAVDYRAIELDREHKTVRLTKPRMRLDLGGIGMGYAVDEALTVLKKNGIRSAMIDASGDIGTLDPPPGKSGWRIGISPEGGREKPTEFVTLNNAALALSGDANQHLEIGGVRYSHIVDPKTGLGLTNRSAVTVIAKDCTTADSYATAISVLGPEKGLKFATETPGVETSVSREIEGTPHRSQSAGWARFKAAE